jgi:LysM repeat protein
MQKRNTAPARVFATAALMCGAFLVVLVIANSTGGGQSGGSKAPPSAGQAAQRGGGARANAPATYIIKNGDTLTSIAHKTGVPVIRIEALNPHIDPQILISGEKLRLR